MLLLKLGGLWLLPPWDFPHQNESHPMDHDSNSSGHTKIQSLTPKHRAEMARGPGVEPGFSDPKSDVLPIRRSPKSERPSRSMPTGALIQKADHTCLQRREGALHNPLLPDLHFK